MTESREPQHPPSLWPPLGVIAQGFQRSAGYPGVALGATAAESDAALGMEVETLQDLARRRQALRDAAIARAPRPGLMLRIQADGRHYGVLLNLPAPQPGYWLGWMLAFESDYAGLADVLLEPEDEPFDPAWGLVQAWHALVLPLPAQYEVVGALNPARLAAVRAVADEWQACEGREVAIDPGLTPAPGVIGLRDTLDGMAVLTGTPVADDAGHDPRAAYRHIYREAGECLLRALAPTAVTRQARVASPATPFWQRLWSPWPALALTLAVLVAQNVWLSGALLNEAQDVDVVRYREVPTAVPGMTVIAVRFQDAAAWQAVSQLLASEQASVVAGPLPGGEYWIDAPDAEQTAQRLSASPLVVSSRLRGL